MNAARHIHEVYIDASPDAVWNAIVDPEFTKQYFYGTGIQSTFGKGDGYRYVMDDGGSAIDGVIEEIEPGRRLVMTFRMLRDAATAAEPPSRVEWVITPTGDTTRLTLRHTDLFASPKTWEDVRTGWLPIVAGIKTLLETGHPLGRIDDPALAAAAEEDPEGAWHRAEAITANNGTWDWLGRPYGELSPADEESMTRSAYAAAYHWSKAAGRSPVNDARATWLLAKVWVTRGHGALALAYADEVLALCAAHGLVDFDLGYAHEARARALACLGRLDEAAEEKALAAAVPIVDDEDRAIFEPDLAAEPWFGLT